MRIVLYKLAGALLLLGSLGFGWVYMDYRAFVDSPLDVASAEREVVIEPGATLSSVARKLEREGLIRSARYFRWMARFSLREAVVQAGTYRVKPGTTPPELLEQMVEGRVVQHALTLVEGWTFHQVMEAIDGNPHLKHTLTGVTPSEIMARLGHPREHPEGRFFPDTYHFPHGLTDLAFLQRAYHGLQERLATEWEGREEGLPLKSPYEALILASIVEKETGRASERPAIAGVFVRRLLKGMRLQTDPTVIYGLGVGFDGNIRRRDLTADTPYNTYRIKGLPPTPIAMPSGAAIHAALHPAPGRSIYFVARGDGSHHFSDTLEEHNAAVVRFQLKGRARPFSSSP